MNFSDLEDTRGTDFQDRAPWCWCDRCRKEIYRGEKYLDLDGRFLCDNCMSQFVHTAGEEDE